MNVLGNDTDSTFVDIEFSDKCANRLTGWDYAFGEMAHNTIMPYAILSSKAALRISNPAMDVAIEAKKKVKDWTGVSVTVVRSKEAVGMADVARTVEMLYQWEQKRQGRMASAYAVYFVESNFSTHNLSAVNSLLLTASIDRLTEWSMVAILRSSFSARDYLPAWSKFMAAVRERLKDNERLEKMLVGLDQ